MGRLFLDLPELAAERVDDARVARMGHHLALKRGHLVRLLLKLRREVLAPAAHLDVISRVLSRCNRSYAACTSSFSRRSSSYCRASEWPGIALEGGCTL